MVADFTNEEGTACNPKMVGQRMKPFIITFMYFLRSVFSIFMYVIPYPGGNLEELLID